MKRNIIPKARKVRQVCLFSGEIRLAKKVGFVGKSRDAISDRIIQLKNNYQQEVFNGDLGAIAAIEEEEQEVMVQFEERRVTYDYADLNELTLKNRSTAVDGA